MTIPELQTAFLNRLPVIYSPPDCSSREYTRIIEIIYTRYYITKTIIVCCTLINEQCSNSNITVRNEYLRLKNQAELTPVDFEIDKEIKKAFVEKLPVTICEPGKKKEDYPNITAIILRLTDDNRIETYCQYKSVEVPSEQVKIKDENESTKTEHINYKTIVDLFIELCPELPKPLKLTDARKKAIKSGIKDGIDFGTVFLKVHQSDFLSGRSGKWKNCSFDWCIKSGNRIKILEGNFDNRESDIRSKASYDIEELEKFFGV